jgi:hypothetical protein
MLSAKDLAGLVFLGAWSAAMISMIMPKLLP